MEKAPDTYRFEAVLERFEQIGGTSFLLFPHSVEELFGTRAQVRVDVKFNGRSYNRALIPKGDGTHFLIISREMGRQLRVQLGDKVQVELTRDLQPEQIAVPEELEAALDLEVGAWEKYEALNPSMRRNIVYWINSAKRPETRANRAVEMLNRIVTGQFHPAKKKAGAETEEL